MAASSLRKNASTLKPARESTSSHQMCVCSRFMMLRDVRFIPRLPSASSPPAADMQLTPHAATVDGRRHCTAVRQPGAVQAPSRHSAIGTRHSAFGTRYLGARHSTSWHSALGIPASRRSALGIFALGTRHLCTWPSLCIAGSVAPAPSHARTLRRPHNSRIRRRPAAAVWHCSSTADCQRNVDSASTASLSHRRRRHRHHQRAPKVCALERCARACPATNAAPGPAQRR
jgi:hypothetical protein